MPNQLIRKSTDYWLVFILCGFGLAGSYDLLAHPFHRSLMELAFNTETVRLEVALEIALEDAQLITSEKGTQQSHQKALMSNLQNQLRFIQEGKSLKWSGFSIETEGQAIWCYFEVSAINNQSDITLHHELLLKQHDEQVNMVELWLGDHKNVIQLNRHARMLTIDLSNI